MFVSKKEKEKYMAKNILIAQIGRGYYIETTYVRVDEKQNLSEAYTTGYTFEAVLNSVEQNQKEIDTLILIGTETSYWGSLCSYYIDDLKDKDEQEKLRKIQDAMPDIKDKIKSDSRNNYMISDISDRTVSRSVEKFLTSRLSEKFNHPIQSRVVILNAGINEVELQGNFVTLLNNIENVLNEGKEKTRTIDIYFDISNGYRSLPMYIYTFTNYLTRIRKENFELHMYYGMSDAKIQKADDKIYAPLVNLNDVNDLMLWINAVNEFRNFGSVKQIKNILKKHEEWDVLITYNSIKQPLSDVFLKFDYAINSNNLQILEETIEIICLLNEELLRETNLPNQAIVLLSDIAEDFKKRFVLDRPEKIKYGYLTLRLSQWFLEQGRIGSAAIALQEGLITYLMERFNTLSKKMNKFEDEGLTDVEYLFDFHYREPVKNAIMNGNFKGNDEFKEKSKKIRERLRNINAHILYKESSWDEINGYESDIRELLDIICRDMDGMALGKTSLFENIFRTNIGFLKDLDTYDLQSEEVPEELRKMLKILQKEVKQMKNLEYKKDANRFINDYKNKKFKIIPIVFRKWIESDFNCEYNDKTIMSRFGIKKKDPKKRLGSDRMLSFCATHPDIIWDINEKY